MAVIDTRRGRDGGPVYRVRVRLKGYRTETATFDRKADAKKWADKTQAEIRDGRHFGSGEAKRRTFAEAIDRYLRDVLPAKPRNRDSKNHAARLKWWRQQLGDHLLGDITAPLLVEQRDRLINDPSLRTGKRRAASTVNHYLSNLSVVFRAAVDEWGWLSDSPLRKLGRRQEPPGRQHPLS